MEKSLCIGIFGVEAPRGRERKKEHAPDRSTPPHFGFATSLESKSTEGGHQL